NWFVYIYGVATHQIVQTSLGYFINPLVNVVLGMLFFHERLRAAQWVAVAFAVGGVVLLAADHGQLPWMPVSLALSRRTAGMVRKLIPVDGLVALSGEVLLLLPVAAAYLGYTLLAGDSALALADAGAGWLLAASGIVTVLPLLWFGHAARALPLSTLGL